MKIKTNKWNYGMKKYISNHSIDIKKILIFKNLFNKYYVLDYLKNYITFSRKKNICRWEC